MISRYQKQPLVRFHCRFQILFQIPTRAIRNTTVHCHVALSGTRYINFYFKVILITSTLKQCNSVDRLILVFKYVLSTFKFTILITKVTDHEI
jgi:hypothetical protein